MTALEEARKVWSGKTDEWLYERLNDELKQKIEEIHRLIKEIFVCEADSNAVLAEVRADIQRYSPVSHNPYWGGYVSALQKISEHFS